MAETKVVDLDILRPPKKIVKIAGKQVDASYVPVALTFDIDKLMRELATVTSEEGAAENEEATRRVLDIECELCGLFASWQHAELTGDFFKQNADVGQINAFVEVIRETLERAYAGIEAHPGNA